MSYLPEPQNDFIFSIIAEEWGFLGAVLVIALFAVWSLLDGRKVSESWLKLWSYTFSWGPNRLLMPADDERGAAAISELGARASYISTDVADERSVQLAVAAAAEAMGGISLAVNCAGIATAGRALGREGPWPTEMFNKVIQVNLVGTFNVLRVVAAQMVKQDPVTGDEGRGVIINTGSGWGLTGGARAASYCASKGAVVNMTRAMALDHGEQNIRVNCVCPGDTETPMLTDDAEMRGLSWQDYEAGASDRPLGRIGTPEEIARAVLFLASDDSSFVTGEALVVDGGGVAG